jgi:antitoxin (DNA-binding transcriptional repressor) of toxin-antitoxin stability system
VTGIAKVASGSYFVVMRAVGLKTLKNKLSEYVRLAASGETVLVTDRDRVVAELGPPAPGRAERLADAQLAELLRQGLVTPPLESRNVPPPRFRIAPVSEILNDLDRDREDR